MKRFISLVLVLIFILSLFGCNNDKNGLGSPSAFEARLSRAGSGRDSRIYENALNVSKLQSDNIQHLPIYKFEALEELEQFKSAFCGESGFDFGWDEVPSFNDVTKEYDNEFFANNTLVLVYIDTNSGSYRFGVNSVYCDESHLCIHVEQTNNPQICTDDLAAWFITVVIPDSTIASCTEFDADLNNTEN